MQKVSFSWSCARKIVVTSEKSGNYKQKKAWWRAWLRHTKLSTTHFL